jgi:hypothetical protein
MIDKVPARILLQLHRLAVGLLPVSLCFWYYRLIVPAEHARVYFVYDNVLYFLSDGITFLAVTAWLCARLMEHQPVWTGGQHLVLLALLGLVVLGSLSTVWSITPALSLYTAAHLWLMLGLFMSVRGEPESWRAIGFGCVAALILESTVAGWEFLAQSTAFLAPLHLTWPGTLVPTVSGPSVVQLADGTRWLRAYGTLPHPNILGGFLLALMAGPLTIFLHGRARRWWAAGLFGIATIALVLTFSRSAWLGYAAGGAVVALFRRSLEGRRLLSRCCACQFDSGGDPPLAHLCPCAGQSGIYRSGFKLRTDLVGESILGYASRSTAWDGGRGVCRRPCGTIPGD